MKRTLFVLVAASALASSAAFAGVANAQRGDPWTAARAVPVQYYEQYQERSDARTADIRERERRISNMIERGVNEGRLRPFEARRAQRELQDIRARARSLEADGRLSGREFGELNRDLDRLADNIRSEMH
jgi:hypothetical protein